MRLNRWRRYESSSKQLPGNGLKVGIEIYRIIKRKCLLLRSKSQI